MTSKKDTAEMTPRSVRRPAMDAYRGETGFLFRFDVPGARRSEFEVQIERGKLRLRAPAGNIEYGRTLRLPEDVDVTASEATLDRGILTVWLRQAVEHRPRRVEIRAA